ncbi:EamA family transporter [Amycolatopsis sp. NPDC004079]|uniref:EamA family transporter n=1 Tax=Amycolatopsis sp. NPDC004079 TaxID=3154549 RepID=UPI0033A3A7B7
MAIRDRLLAVFVAVLWGLNFIAIHATLGQFPPMFAGALRFLLIAIPTVFLVPWPRVKLRYLLGYGLGFGTGQFAFLFVAMHLGMPTGLASLVLQASAPFTVLLGAVLLRERVSGRQLAGILLAVAGMTAIAWQQSAHAALIPVVLTLLAALSWAIGNLSMRRAEPDNPLHLTLWMSVVPPLPMLALSSIFEGPGAALHSLTTLGTKTGLIGVVGLAYVVIFGTVIGSGIWTTLMRRNPAGVVAPFSLLVPVVGLTASFFILGEVPTVLTLVAAAVVIGGVLLGSLRRKPAVTPEELLPV